MQIIDTLSKKQLRQLVTQNRGFSVTYDDGNKNGAGAWYKHGTTTFYDENGKVEAEYAYVEDQCDYLSSKGFEPGSMGFDRQKACIKQNKKLKLKNDIDLCRFFTLDKGFYSLRELYEDKLKSLKTPSERLESIHRKVSGSPYANGKVERWCKSQACACLGCANGLLSWDYAEYCDYIVYRRAKALGII
ncbi:hypothetical protein [Vibrio parahaemolyticus]|uniref:hypothetical protein n=1 Tax=Vibrio parahaemolyticus TaxID=670 RepID=UPI00226A96F7|nr:hypothetical protein [Vibrio parahaemolyticus]MCX8795745.1 hypothetical protein [Vibrio parahaemolyticus]